MNKGKVWKITALALGGISTFAVVGATTFIIAKSFNKITYPHLKAIASATSNVNSPNERPITVDLYNGPNLTYSTSPVLDQAHLKTLANKIRQTPFLGPEFAAVKRIAINDPRLITQGENGVYYYATGEIGLCTYGIENYMQNVVTQATNHSGPFTHNYNDDIQDLITEYLYGTFYHEYGHHIFLTYPGNPYLKFNNVTQDLYNNVNNKRVPYKYNQAFVTAFKNLFNYNNAKAPSPKTIGNYGFIWNYSLKTLYESANGSQNLLKPISGKNQVLFQGGIKGDLLPGAREIATLDNLNYLYSLDELLTRKMLLSSEPQTQELINMENGAALKQIIQDYHLTSKPIANNKLALLTNTTKELAKYDDPNLTPSKTGAKLPLTLDYDYQPQQFMADNPFNNQMHPVAQSYMQLVAKATGAMFGDNLSFIHHYSALSVDRANGNRLFGKIESGDKDQIIFGGYLPQNANFNFVGYQDQKGQVHKIAPINMSVQANTGFEYKPKLFASAQHTMSLKPQKYWVTSQYTNAKQYQNQPLVFFNQDQNRNIIDVTPLSTFRGQTDQPQSRTLNEKIAGIASSYQDTDPYNIAVHNSGWTAAFNNQKQVMIRADQF